MLGRLVYRETDKLTNEGTETGLRNSDQLVACYPSVTFQLVKEQEYSTHRAELRMPEQSGSFKELERQLG